MILMGEIKTELLSSSLLNKVFMIEATAQYYMGVMLKRFYLYLPNKLMF